MKAFATIGWPVLLTGILLTGCSREESPSKQPGDSKEPNAAGARYLLAAEPTGARSVKELRKDAKDGDNVVIVGHIGGDKNPWVEGRASFWIVDSSIKPCPPEEGCKTPWDCCCEPKEELLKVMATIKVVDGQGQTIAVDARQLLGVKESQTVVVQGQAKRDDKGNLTVLANGVFVRR